MTTKPQTFLEIFQDILAASGNSSDSLNQSQIVSVLRKQASAGGDDLESLLFKVMNDARNRLNLSLTPDTCGYCDGDFREVIQAYNRTHGYVSLLVFDIHTKNITDAHGNPGIAYHVDPEFNGRLYQANFWVHGVIIKLLPCSILTVISIWLIRALYSANRHQKNLRNNSGCPAAEKMVKRQLKADKRTDRTTKMLLAVLLLFLVTELPQGILGLMSGLLGWCFFKRCYDLFGELMDFLALLNGAINFVLYCSMSRQFRQTFRHMVLQPPLARWLPPVASHSDTHIQNTKVMVKGVKYRDNIKFVQFLLLR
ncbi:hypothetical protein MSG28_008602 [Choristoneura fumiferana]|uniref:Uncharacterized protein n=1 Tax=Choristoneura fumiferana TaxID=7141 RepID=A0ACC0J7F0_CHOFU|nr:hypothetical protein MSG28_008602 [Choristoneura fumiferana]